MSRVSTGEVSLESLSSYKPGLSATNLASTQQSTPSVVPSIMEIESEKMEKLELFPYRGLN